MAAAAPAAQNSISQIAAFLNAGSYGQAFQLASTTGNIGLLEHPDTLYQIAPNAFKTKAQFDSFYTAFTPYLKQMAGQASGGQGRYYGDATAWNGGANILGEANMDFADSASAASRIAKDQATVDQLVKSGAQRDFMFGGKDAGPSLNLPFAGTIYTALGQAERELAADKSDAAPDLSRYLSNDKTYEAENRANNLDLASFALTVATMGVGAAGGAAALAAEEGVSVGVAGAEIGALEGAAGAAIGGGNPLTGALTGGLGGFAGAGGFGNAGNTIGTALGASGSTATGIGNTLLGAGTGALGGALSGKGAGAGALTGGLTAGIGSALSSAGAPSSISKIGGKILGGEIGSSLLGSSSTSGSGHPTPVTSAPKPAGGPNVDTLDPITSLTSPITSGNVSSGGASSSGSGLGSALSGLGSGLASGIGLDPNNLAGSIGSTLGGLGPYAAIGALGLEQAKSGRQQDQNYVKQAASLGQPLIDQSKQTLAGYNAGTLSTTDQKVVDTAQKQGQSIIDSANPLSSIAAKAFQQYASGQLSQADQLTLNNQVAAQKAQVRSQLQSQGITDSTILAAQDQQIDNNAIITKQNLLQAQFSLGNQAYDTWLQSTTQGQQEILAGQQFASTELQQSLTNALNEAQLGTAPIMSSIEMAMQSDAQYADQVSQLMGTLASAYAYQQAKKAGAGGTSSGTSAGSGGSGSSAGGGTSSGGNFTGTAPDPNSLGDYLSGSSAGFDNSLSDSMNSSLDDYFSGQDSPVSGWMNFDDPMTGSGSLGDIETLSWG